MVKIFTKKNVMLMRLSVELDGKSSKFVGPNDYVMTCF